MYHRPEFTAMEADPEPENVGTQETSVMAGLENQRQQVVGVMLPSQFMLLTGGALTAQIPLASGAPKPPHRISVTHVVELEQAREKNTVNSRLGVGSMDGVVQSANPLLAVRVAQPIHCVGPPVTRLSATVPNPSLI